MRQFLEPCNSIMVVSSFQQTFVLIHKEIKKFCYIFFWAKYINFLFAFTITQQNKQNILLFIIISHYSILVGLLIFKVRHFTSQDLFIPIDVTANLLKPRVTF